MKTFSEYLFEAMKTVIGKNAKTLSWQLDWPEKIKCTKKGCNGDAELIIACQEDNTTPKDRVADIHDNQPNEEKFWPHDYIAVANYICRKCFSITSKINQA